MKNMTDFMMADAIPAAGQPASIYGGWHGVATPCRFPTHRAPRFGRVVGLLFGLGLLFGVAVEAGAANEDRKMGVTRLFDGDFTDTFSYTGGDVTDYAPVSAPTVGSVRIAGGTFTYTESGVPKPQSFSGQGQGILHQQDVYVVVGTRGLGVRYKNGLLATDYVLAIVAVDGTVTQNLLPTSPGAPSNLAATASSPTAVALTWTAPTELSVPALTYYSLVRSTSMDLTTAPMTFSIDKDTLTYDDSGLTTGTTYYYQVTAGNANGLGTASATVSATPTAMVGSTPTPVSEQVARVARITKDAVPAVSQAITVQAADAIVARIGAVGRAAAGASASLTDADVERGYVRVAGHADWSSALAHNAAALADGSREARALLDGTVFAMPLTRAGLNAGDAITLPAFWVSGAYAQSSDKEGALSWDGKLTSVSAGVDWRIGGARLENLLIGVAVTESEGEFDYVDGVGADASRGEFGVELTTVQPYMGWRNDEGTDWWLTAGSGYGEIEISEVDDDFIRTTRTSDIEVRTLGGGASKTVRDYGRLQMRAKGDVASVATEVDGDTAAAIRQTSVRSNRVRVALEMAQEYAVSGGSMHPQIEVGLRHYDGDVMGELEVGLAHRGENGLVVQGNYTRVLASGDYDEWGLQGSVRYESQRGQGLSLRLDSGYGRVDDGDGGDGLWNGNVYADAGLNVLRRGGDEDAYQMRMDARVGYGVSAPMGGMVTPYSEFGLSSSGRTYRLGGDWEVSSRFSLGLVGEYKQPEDAVANQAITLKGGVRF